MNSFTTFNIVLDNLLVLCVCMLVGFICRKTKLINDEVNKGLSNLLMKVAFPCTIIMSMQRPFTKELAAEGAMVAVIFTLVFFLGAALGVLYCRLSKTDIKETGVWLYALAMPNIVYMGLPVIQAIYGTDAVFYISFGVIPFNIISFTIGINWITMGYVSEKWSIKSLLSNVALMSTFVGLILFLLSISLPATLSRAFSMIGGMTAPISTIIIGGLLAKEHLREIFNDWTLYALSFIKLIIIPVIVFFALKPWLENQVMLGVIVMVASMPPATSTAIFAEQYNGNAVFASKVVFISTLLCILTIPLVSLLL